MQTTVKRAMHFVFSAVLVGCGIYAARGMPE